MDDPLADGGDPVSRVVIGAAAVTAVLVLALLAVGWRPVVLLSDSMAPAAPAGSLLLSRPVDPGQVSVGDVVTVPLDGSQRVTQRVVALEQLDGATWARLRGDANRTPGPGRVQLDEPLRTVAVVPGLGRLATGGTPLLLAGLGLLAIGVAGLALVDRRHGDPPPEPVTSRGPGLPSGRNGLDTRVVALGATLGAYAEDGMDPVTLRALAQARLGPLLGLGPVDASPAAASVDDGARFVLVALADADDAALAIVPPDSARAVTAREVLATWWSAAEDRVPAAVQSALADVLAVGAPRGGVAGSAPVD